MTFSSLNSIRIDFENCITSFNLTLHSACKFSAPAHACARKFQPAGQDWTGIWTRRLCFANATQVCPMVAHKLTTLPPEVCTQTFNRPSQVCMQTCVELPEHFLFNHGSQSLYRKSHYLTRIVCVLDFGTKYILTKYPAGIGLTWSCGVRLARQNSPLGVKISDKAFMIVQYSDMEQSLLEIHGWTCVSSTCPMTAVGALHRQ